MRRAVIAMILLVFATAPLVARPRGFDLPALNRQCQVQDCDRAIQSVILRLKRSGLHGEALDEQLGYLALILYHATQEERRHKPRSRERVAAAFRRVAGHVHAPWLEHRFHDVADAIDDGEDEFWDEDDPDSASPD